MKIGVFGGAFNPVHNGHLNIADGFFDDLGLDKIIFIPTAIPPHKSSDNLASQSDRINMLTIAIDGKHNYDVSSIEFERKEKSYTYDTLCRLKSIYPDSKFYLIIGADQFLSFHNWYRFKDILEMAVICTSARDSEEERQAMADYGNSLPELNGNFYLSNRPVLKLSSSEIRQRIKNGKDFSSLVPEGVCNYILEKGLYGV